MSNPADIGNYVRKKERLSWVNNENHTNSGQVI